MVRMPIAQGRRAAGVRVGADMAERDIADAELVRRAQDGQESAFDQIVLRYQERIVGLASRLVRDPDEAMDIAQETFIRAYRQMPRFRGDSALYTWLHRIAANLSINRLRRQKVLAFLSLDSAALPAAGPEPEEELERVEFRRQVDAAVAALPPRQRAIFVLRHFEQLSHRQIAEILGSSEGAVRAGYFHAVKKLQHALRDLR
jgi:RNA polymerase sigma-70 factor (ECF subfamily)